MTYLCIYLMVYIRSLYWNMRYGPAQSTRMLEAENEELRRKLEQINREQSQ